jgi:5-aminopentanamidase
MQQLRIATAQFEHKGGDKVHNLTIMANLAKTAAAEGADIICFHESCITGYAYARKFSKAQMLDIAEFIPTGESMHALQQMAAANNIIVLAGLFEKDHNDTIYKAFVCVDKNGLIANHRKLHPFINTHITPGNSYTVFELLGWKCGILICYDNNIAENVRATHLLGADIIFMPHVTMCTPSTRPGAGFVDAALWYNREIDPTSLRIEFDGLKGREWLMKWLPARAYDNAIYAVFANAIGMDDDQLKNGCSMIVDPFGDIIAECRKLGNDVIIATITQEKITQAGGYRYTNARRPELYADIIGKPHQSVQNVVWLQKPQ